MRKVLAVVIVAAILGMGASAFAQIPNVQPYFDKNLTETQGYCQGFAVKDTLSIVCNNFNMFMSSVEFGITPPATDAIWSADIYLPGSLHLGQTNTGTTISFNIPRNAFLPCIVMYYEITWLCTDCLLATPNVPIVVIPHPGTGKLRAVEWQTFRQVNGVGMTALICPLGVGTEPSTWGKVKSLYSE